MKRDPFDVIYRILDNKFSIYKIASTLSLKIFSRLAYVTFSAFDLQIAEDFDFNSEILQIERSKNQCKKYFEKFINLERKLIKLLIA